MKTKNKRLLIIFTTFCLIVFLSIFSSQLFKLRSVEINFYDENKIKVNNITTNAVFNTKQKIEEVLSSASFDYGNFVFLINKNNYAPALERNNPYLKLQNIQIKFPNKLVVNASERKPRFYIKSYGNIYLLDNEFKLLEILPEEELILNNNQILQTLLQISVQTPQGGFLDFFRFFDVLPTVYEAGQNLAENNTVLNSLLPLWEILYNYTKNMSHINSAIFDNLILQEDGANVINLKITTSLTSFGASLVVENIFSNFSKKLNKLLNAFNSLKKVEPIKCSYGQLKIDNNLNCYWNNL